MNDTCSRWNDASGAFRAYNCLSTPQTRHARLALENSPLGGMTQPLAMPALPWDIARRFRQSLFLSYAFHQGRSRFAPKPRHPASSCEVYDVNNQTEQLEGLTDDVGRVRVDELRVPVDFVSDSLLQADLKSCGFRLLSWCFQNCQVLLLLS